LPSAAPPALLKLLPGLAANNRPTPSDLPASKPRSPDTEATRLGKAVHRVLEWATSRPLADDASLTQLAQAAALEFNASASAIAQLARVILNSPECSRFFTGSLFSQLRWHGNEVPVSDEGEALRIDRLVHLEDEDGSTWWVLDYKLHHAPQQLEGYRDQLQRYRAAVRRAQPGATVRCAFVTGAGAVIEID
jgi:ATP-dependent helicase/nuclease subunit A